jgi:hypothetical protein
MLAFEFIRCELITEPKLRAGSWPFACMRDESLSRIPSRNSVSLRKQTGKGKAITGDLRGHQRNCRSKPRTEKKKNRVPQDRQRAAAAAAERRGVTCTDPTGAGASRVAGSEGAYLLLVKQESGRGGGRRRRRRLFFFRPLASDRSRTGVAGASRSRGPTESNPSRFCPRRWPPRQPSDRAGLRIGGEEFLQKHEILA